MLPLAVVTQGGGLQVVPVFCWLVNAPADSPADVELHSAAVMKPLTFVEQTTVTGGAQLQPVQGPGLSPFMIGVAVGYAGGQVVWPTMVPSIPIGSSATHRATSAPQSLSAQSV